MPTGTIRKMRTEYGAPVNYFLPVGSEEIPLNKIIGSELKLDFTGNIYCVKCGEKTKKSFAQGFCYKCFVSSPETEDCVLRPELCQAHVGIARDMTYAEEHCLIDHYVYLANSSSLKVGVTRHTQIPTRWIDQGASEAILFAKTPNRFLAGKIEVALKDHLSDKTNWRNMLKNVIEEIELTEEKKRVSKLLPEIYKQFLVKDAKIQEITYPVNKFPEKVKSFSFDKEQSVGGILNGIKGQYLLFENDYCLNVRKFGGYEIKIES
jgi:hypothetical protein